MRSAYHYEQPSFAPRGRVRTFFVFGHADFPSPAERMDSDLFFTAIRTRCRCLFDETVACCVVFAIFVLLVDRQQPKSYRDAEHDCLFSIVYVVFSWFLSVPTGARGSAKTATSARRLCSSHAAVACLERRAVAEEVTRELPARYPAQPMSYWLGDASRNPSRHVTNGPSGHT